MGILAAAEALFSRMHPLAGNTDFCYARVSEIAGFGPRRFAGGRSAWPAAGTESEPAGGRRPLRGGTHRRDLRRKGRTSPSWPPAVPPACNSPIRFMAIQFRLQDRPCVLERHRIAFSRHCSSRKISTPNCRDKSWARHAKAAGQPHACASPSTAGQVPAGLPAKPGPGKTWTSQARPRLPQAHQQQLCSQNCRSCSGPPWTLRLSQFCVQGNRVRLTLEHRHPFPTTPSRSAPA